MNLSFEYSPEFEVERVKYTIDRLDWYLKNKYSLSSLSFPQKLNSADLKSLPLAEIEEAVNNEYDENKYSSNVESIKQIFDKYKPQLITLIKELGLAEISDIKIYLTSYGMGGSYHYPNKVVANIERFFGLGLAKNVLHEIIHLHIEPLVQKYQVGQWEKETIVNLLFEKTFPEIYKEPHLPINTEQIKKNFTENYPNIGIILSKISTEKENFLP